MATIKENTVVTNARGLGETLGAASSVDATVIPQRYVGMMDIWL